MDISIRESHPDDAPHLALIAGVKLGEAIQWFVGGKVFVACRDKMPIAFIAAHVGDPGLTCYIKQMSTMPFYRRLGVMRRLWVTMLAAMPFTTWRCVVSEYEVEAQCTLRQFGFTCGKVEGGAMHFKRRG